MSGEKSYRVLADQVIDAFNPPDGDDAEEYICENAIVGARRYIERQPCVCPPEAGFPDYNADPCDRCTALGRAKNVRIDR